jgi:hypothetical protein
MQSARVFIDSNDRFEDDFKNKSFWKLPHDENGFVQLDAIVVDGVLTYENKPVVTLEDYASRCNVQRGQKETKELGKPERVFSVDTGAHENGLAISGTFTVPVEDGPDPVEETADYDDDVLAEANTELPNETTSEDADLPVIGSISLEEPEYVEVETGRTFDYYSLFVSDKVYGDGEWVGELMFGDVPITNAWVCTMVFHGEYSEEYKSHLKK